jgi:hypothetical protein
MLEQDADRLTAISRALLPAPNAPVLRQINGFGSALYGHFVEGLVCNPPILCAFI